MPNEIPDSDEESDYEDGPDPQPADATFAEQTLPNVGDRGLDINFDDFISQTQSARDGSSQLGQTKRSTASTQKHLRDALENRAGSASSTYDESGVVDQSAGDHQLPKSGTGPRKRAHSEVGGRHGHKASSQSHTKRTKTYSANLRRVTPTQDIEEPLQPANIKLAEFATHFAAMSPPQGEVDEQDIVSQAKNTPRRAVSLLGDSVSNASHALSMTNSSIGGYQSYNLDFRGSGSGMDINTNPFGALSQVSVDVGIEHTAEETRTDFSSIVPSGASPRPPGRDAISPLTDAGFGPQPIAEIPTSIDLSALIVLPPEDSQMLTSPAATRAPQKSTSTFTNTSSYDIRESQIEIQTTSNQTEGTITSKTRGQTSKAWRQPSLAPTEAMIIDQQDDGGNTIDLSKERYKPRPSKSRGSTTEPERQSQPDEDGLPAKKRGRKKYVTVVHKTTEYNSPVKFPTSELNLSDEAIIGLPKENYKPRPSRRRSRMIAGDEDAIIEVETGSVYSKDQEQPMQSQESKHSEASHTLEVADPATPKPKKGKKAKERRAKTSAAYLLKKSEPMISDGEDDVLWVETKQTKVKLDIPAPTPAKEVVDEENTAEDMVTVEALISGKVVEGSQGSSKLRAPARSTTVTVEIPARAEDKVEPKKRGRKAKAVAINGKNDTEPEASEDTTSIPATDPPASSPPSCATTSTILKEKDNNKFLPPPTPEKPTESSSPTKVAKIIHSPINPSGGKVLYRIGLSRRSAIPPLLKIVKPPAKQQAEKENLDEDGQPRDLVAETMKKWREMGVLD